MLSLLQDTGLLGRVKASLGLTILFLVQGGGQGGQSRGEIAVAYYTASVVGLAVLFVV